MEEVTYEKFINLIEEYNPLGVEEVKRCYQFAEELHKGQFRQSGDPYITHPLNVAYILAEMKADRDTICAGLLHDTLEDTEITKEDIAELFNKDVANLVDGVTKLAKMNFSSKEDQNFANARKIITGITEDVRIIIIKLADRLHNMRTLGFKSEFKQKENSLETMDIFVPLAYYIGAYRIKSELEDISFRYLYPSDYEKITNIKLKIESESESILQEMLIRIERILSSQNIPYEIKLRAKNVYGIYRRLKGGYRLSDIHDLLSMKVIVDSIDNCYRALGLIHQEYHPVNRKFKDYICNPKTNMYQSLHTTVFGPQDKLIQMQIRTFEMDKIASFGLTAYWDLNGSNARDTMQEDLKNKYQFFRSLNEINMMFSDNQEFVSQVKSELFSDKIYVYTTKGVIIELPKGATAIDLAYAIGTDIGNTMVGAVANDEYVPVDYVLENKDRVRIITDDLSYGPREDWLEKVITSNARQRIREFNRK